MKYIISQVPYIVVSNIDNKVKSIVEKREHLQNHKNVFFLVQDVLFFQIMIFIYSLKLLSGFGFNIDTFDILISRILQISYYCMHSTGAISEES